MHLQIAEDFRAFAEAEGRNYLLQLLEQEWPAFYLGSVAADFQTICGVPRAKTHFYELPPAPEEEAHSIMLESHPELAHVAAMRPGHALFVSAYMVHLVFDLLWFRQILMPYFVNTSDWGDFPQRRLVHHILLTYLDRQAFEALPDTAAAVLAAAQPRGWLPFAADADLTRWRDMLVDQMQPGATLQTAEIYARRLRMSPDEFARKLEDQEWIRDRVFRNVPVTEVQARLEAALPECVDLIAGYLNSS